MNAELATKPEFASVARVLLTPRGIIDLSSDTVEWPDAVTEAGREHQFRTRREQSHTGMRSLDISAIIDTPECKLGDPLARCECTRIRQPHCRLDKRYEDGLRSEYTPDIREVQ